MSSVMRRRVQNVAILICFAGILTFSWMPISQEPTHLEKLLQQVRDGETSVDAALGRLRHLPFEDLGFARVDHHRALRHGMPEVIFGQGKTVGQVEGIATAILARSPNLL